MASPLISRHNIRQDSSYGLGSVADAIAPAGDADGGIDVVEAISDPLLRIDHPDGSITISIDGKPVYEDDEPERVREWFANIVEDIDASERSRICEELLRGITDDLESRRNWIENRAAGLRLLGLTVESGSPTDGPDSAPVEGMSRVRHPMLLDACVRFQANAMAELLPTDGPVKVRVDFGPTQIETDETATVLERDLNHYLTVEAPEYYPDTDRMLFMLGFGGTAFKKVYFCPLRGRPVSESVDAEDLIVNNAATALEDARRITHRVMMRSSAVRRMQILGVYRDIDLITPGVTDVDSVRQEKASQQGVTPDAANPEDRDREIYECYCELDIKGFEHRHKGKITGLEIPWRVTIDVSSREILSVVRNYDEPTGESGDILPKARANFVKYSFIPGLGFYDIGLLHLMGNTTTAATALWREMLDAGMYANFPGLLIADAGARQQTNLFRVPPGGAAMVKTGGVPINQAVMPLPYKEPGPAMFNLVENVVQTGRMIGGTAETAVGDGRQDAPVGTTLALLDQATKPMSSVHKRLHRAQTEEFRLIVRTFRENPESFLSDARGRAAEWTESQFVDAISRYDLTPQADPNTASQTHRNLKIMGLKELQAASPQNYDSIAVDIAAMKALGWSNPEQFLLPEDERNQIPPEMQESLAKIKSLQADTQAKQVNAQANMIKAQAVAAKDASGGMSVNPVEMQMQAREMDARAMESRIDAINRQRDRESRERLAAIRVAEKMADNPSGLPIFNKMIDPAMMDRLENNESPIPGSNES